MDEYTLIDPVTGEQWILPASELTRNLRLNCILLRGNVHLGIITHRDLIAFTRWCLGEMLARLKGERDQKIVRALALVDRWLEDERCLTPEELEASRLSLQAAAGAAWSAYRSAHRHGPDSGSFARAVDTTWVAVEAVANVADAVPSASLTAIRAAQYCTQYKRAHASYEAQARWLVKYLQSGK